MEIESYLRPIVVGLCLIFGLIFGSFATMLVYRVPNNLNLNKPRSSCDKCKRQLKWYNLIPIFSYVFQLGKCAKCKKAIGLQSILIEVSMVASFSLIGLLTEKWLNLFLLLILAFGTIVLGVIDLKHFLLPRVIILPLISIGLVLGAIFDYKSMLGPVLFGGGLSLFMFALWFFSGGRGIGFGDVRLAFLTGYIAAFYGVLVAYFAFVIALFATVLFIVLYTTLSKTQFRGLKIPFGPTIMLASWLVLLGWMPVQI